MAMRRVLLASAMLATPTLAKLECRQPNYVTHDGKIWAQDPATPGTETEITIRGVSWSGMEKENMIPDGLWDSKSANGNGIIGTKVSTVIEFLTNNSINSLRLPLSAQYLMGNNPPQMSFINSWENKELTTWTSPSINDVRYYDLIGRMIQTFQESQISILLDIHLLDKYASDAYWYTAPYSEITKTQAYLAAEGLAKAFCNATYWNVLGIDLKDEMTDVEWNDKADSNLKRDWRTAASTIANRVIELCPSWLVFIEGASSPTAAQTFTIDKGYDPSVHWAGGNLHNATKNPLNVTLATKIVMAPHAHSHGKRPQNYFYAPGANCTDSNPAETFGLDNTSPECVDWIKGTKVTSKLGCSTGEFGCAVYKQLTPEQIATNYQKVMDQAIGDVLKAGQYPVILGSFAGVYGADFQPHQTAALDFLVNYAATNLRGGYFWALNPDTEYFLEDSATPGSGLFGKTHYGVFKMSSWQDPNLDLLEALKKLPSTEIPCYGGKKNSKGGKSAASIVDQSVSVMITMASVLMAAWYAI